MENKKKIIWAGIGLATTSVLGYFGWQYWRNKSDSQIITPEFASEPAPSAQDFTPVAVKTKVSTPKTETKSEFPLKKGSKNAKVKALQDALIAKYGRQIMPKYGADGDFGSELAAALKKLNLPAQIDESTFNVIVADSKANLSSLASGLVQAANTKNYTKALGLLTQITNKDDYSKVSEQFKQARIAGGVRQTLVNGMLNTFTSEVQKQAIRLEFLRMGLKYDGDKWSLSGINGFQIITTKETLVWKNPKTAIKVPANMILGGELARRGEYSLFENNARTFLVLTSTIKYL